MLYLILPLVLLGIVAAAFGWWHERRLKQKLERGEISELPTMAEVQNMECCGQHEVCEKESLLAAVSREVQYYDDEELDRFAGRRGEEYSDEETDEFRDVMLTMQSDEVAGWIRSLQLRGVELPDDLRDEVVMIVGERR